MDRNIIIRLEPSKRLSELCGFPYFIECRVSVGELLGKGMIDDNDVRKMEGGNEICKRWRVDNAA